MAVQLGECNPAAAPEAGLFDYEALRETSLERVPFDYAIVRRFVTPEHFSAITAGFPKGLSSGSHPVHLLKLTRPIAALVDELQSARFRAAIEDKFDIDLTGLPTACTLRGATAAKDGQIHTDSRSKVITVLLYLNEAWTVDCGQLRLLRSATDLDDYAVEVPPTEGTLLVFRRSDQSWHGHKPFVGPRKAIQFNWVANSSIQMRERVRHGVTHVLKTAVHVARSSMSRQSRL